jgi:hypothetical protein
MKKLNADIFERLDLLLNWIRRFSLRHDMRMFLVCIKSLRLFIIAFWKKISSYNRLIVSESSILDSAWFTFILALILIEIVALGAVLVLVWVTAFVAWIFFFVSSEI